MTTEKAREVLRTAYPLFFDEIEGYLSFYLTDKLTEEELIDDFLEYLNK